jgi:hypothetical protein
MMRINYLPMNDAQVPLQKELLDWQAPGMTSEFEMNFRTLKHP